ncbi:MAG: pyridoxamine 5'-phosphate oxidase family protein, partial [Acidimicrobiales bacterium]
MQIEEALAFVREHKQGVLVTLRRDGRPQLSNIIYGVDDTGVIRISVTAPRAKARNAARDPRVSL